MDGSCPRRRLAFTMLGTLGELSLFALWVLIGEVYSLSNGDNPPQLWQKRPVAYEPGCADRDEIRR